MAVDNSVMDLTLPLDDIHIDKECLLGRGGYGNVYRGCHDRLGLVAVKLMIEGGSLPNQHLRDLKREAERLKTATNHPHIVDLHGVLMEKEHYGLVLEYMHFGSVAYFVREYTVDVSLRVRITSQVISAMDYLHGYDPPILHLDMKADNVLIDKHLNAKICDFGLSEWKTVTVTVTRRVSSTSSRPCTITHISPEVLRNINLKSNAAIDVYAFGITIWEIFTGLSPYGNHSDDLIRQSVLNDQRPDMSQIPQDCPMDIQMLMVRCWNGIPAVRPTFNALKTEIRPVMSRYEKMLPRALISIRNQVKEKFCVNDEEYSGTEHLDELEVMEEDEADLTVPSVEAPMDIDTAQDTTEADAVMEVENESRTTQDSGNRSIPIRHPLKVVVPETLSLEEENFRKVLRSPLAMAVITSNVGESLNCSIKGRRIVKSCDKLREHLDTDINLRNDLMSSNIPFVANLNNPTLADGMNQSRAIQKDRQTSSDMSALKKHPDRSSVSRSDREAKINRNRVSMQQCKYSTRLHKNGLGQKLMKALKEPYFMNDEIMKGGGKTGGKSEGGEKFDTVDPTVIEAAKDPVLLQIALSQDKQLLDNLMRNYAPMMMKLIAENKTQYKSPKELKEEDERRRQLERERRMEKERDRMRDRMRYMGHHGNYYDSNGYWDNSDDDDIDLEDNRRMMQKGYPEMRKHARHPMMDYQYYNQRVGMPMELFMRGPNHMESAMKRKQKDRDVRNIVRTAKELESNRLETFRNKGVAKMEEEQKKKIKQFKEEQEKKDKMTEDKKKKAGVFGGLVGVFNKNKEESLFDAQSEAQKASLSGLPSNEVDQGSMDPDNAATTSSEKSRTFPVPPRSEQNLSVLTSAQPDGQPFQAVGPPGDVYQVAPSTVDTIQPPAAEAKVFTVLNQTQSQQPTQNQSLNCQPMEVEPSQTHSANNEPVSFGRSQSPSDLSSSPKFSSPRDFGMESPSSRKQTERNDLKKEKSSSTGSSGEKAGAPITIVHKHADGGQTKLTITNDNVKPNLQVGNKNVMIVGGGGNSCGARGLDEEAVVRKKKPSRKNVNLTKSEKMLDMDQIDLIASDIGKDSKRLCRQMGLSDAEVEQIEQDYHINGTYEIMYQGITRWTQRNGKAATVRKMAEYLYDIDRLDLAKQLK